jgi:nucleotide-binding universal stress UspA family protein
MGIQLRKILAAVRPDSPDGHPLRAALELASRGNVRLVVLSVTESPWQLAGAAAPGALADMPSRGELVARAADGLSRRFRPLIAPRMRDRVAMHTAIGLPAVEIARWSEREGADLVVLGREGRGNGRVGRLDGGDTVEGTVRRLRVPCLIAPASGRASVRRVLAAVDGGPDARDVLAAALTVGRLWGAEVRALHVEQPALVGVGATPVATAHPTGAVDAAAAYELVVRQGEPVSEVLRALREDDVDLLVIGHHRGGPGGGHATDSIATRLLARAPCAVLTVPI